MRARMNPTRPSNDAAMAGAVRARALLIIEDDPPIRRALRNALGEVAERLLEAPTGKTGIDIAATERPDLVILDLGLPDLEGVAVCREIRSWSPVPIVVLSARHSDAEKVQLLNAGADDYITKPFSTAEFVARMRAVLRRARSPGAADVPATVEAYGLTIDLVHRRVTRAGTPIRLTPIEWDILRTLVERRTHAHASADLRSRVGSGGRQSAAIPAGAHHESASQDRGACRPARTRRDRAGSRLSRRAAGIAP